MSRLTCGLVVLALLTAGCVQPPPVEPQGPSADGMLTPNGAIDPAYAETTFSLADLYADRLKLEVSNSDRREMDAALDRVFVDLPERGPAPWRNPVTRHTGLVDLASWRVDERRGKLCGTIQHQADLERKAAGVVIVCRSNTEPAWSVDEVVWREVSEPQTTRRRPDRPSNNTVVNNVINNTVVNGGGSGTGGSGTGGGSSGSGGTPPSDTNTRPPAYQPPACPDAPGAGSQTLGDCLAAPTS